MFQTLDDLASALESPVPALPSHIFRPVYQTMFCVHSVLSLESLPLRSDLGQILFL